MVFAEVGVETRLVSIVIPAYNYAPFLVRAIESVLNQDYQNIELIVLDDGSTDNTRKILEQYGDAFRWQSHENMGQANTLNKGWKLAKGDVLSYLSADDELLPNAVSASLRFLQDDVVLTYCDFNLFDPSSRLIRKVTAPDFDYCEMFSQLVCHPGPGVFMTREAFEAAGLWNSSYRQMPDYDYWLRLGLQGRFVRVPEVLASFRVHEQSQTFAVADEKKALEPLQIISNYIDSNKMPPELEALKIVALSNAWIAVAQLHTRAGRFFLGWRAFQQAFIIYPRNFTRLRTGKIILNSLLNRSLHRLVRWKNSLLR